MAKCQKCGQRGYDNFCANCGGRMQDDPSCNWCGNKLPEGAAFCNGCGQERKVALEKKPTFTQHQRFPIRMAWVLFFIICAIRIAVAALKN
ncbi:hypothetical protein EPO05_04660 [Patescibacteria group bacterium]|nr:MAG: hypothetical protein EPO05_04660 [Patescibacteria group bacterium]